MFDYTRYPNDRPSFQKDMGPAVSEGNVNECTVTDKLSSRRHTNRKILSQTRKVIGVAMCVWPKLPFAMSFVNFPRRRFRKKENAKQYKVTWARRAQGATGRATVPSADYFIGRGVASHGNMFNMFDTYTSNPKMMAEVHVYIRKNNSLLHAFHSRRKKKCLKK